MPSGDIYFPSDGHSIRRSTGSVWNPWGPIFPLTDPTLPTWAWFNQGARSVANAYGGVELTVPKVNGYDISGRDIAVPGSTPWSKTACFLACVRQWNFLANPATGGSLDFWKFGIMLNDGTKISTFGYPHEGAGGPAGHLYLMSWTDKATFSTARAGGQAGTLMTQIPKLIGNSPLMYFRIRDDGTNWFWELSGDGVNFVTYFREARNTFQTATRVGWFAYFNTANANATDSIVRLIHWA